MSNSSNRFKPVKTCHICQGEDSLCEVCEGTGIVLLDEDNQDIAQMFFNEENFDENDE